MSDGAFEPEKYQDEYRLRVLAMIDEKVKGREITAAAQPVTKPEAVIDLMEALRQSMKKVAEKSRRRAAEGAKEGRIKDRNVFSPGQDQNPPTEGGNMNGVALLSFYVFFTSSGVYRGDIAPALTALAASTRDTPTASDQAENEADRELTQQVRQAITRDGAVSTSAKNVTIVSRDGNVTLRGIVKSLSEKQIIAEKAKQVSGVKNLDNQITVKK